MLCDSNILIYAAEPGDTVCAPYVEHAKAAIASVTRIEVLGFPGFAALSAERQMRLQEVVDSFLELPLDGPVIQRAVELRQRRKMGLADSVIAATALAHGLPLVTRNVNDYQRILGLTVLNPFDGHS